MTGKKRLILSALCFVLVFGIVQALAQPRAKTVGNIHLTVQPFNIVGEESEFDASVPVNERFPILIGESLGLEQSHGDSWKLQTFAVADRNSNEEAFLTLTLNVFRKGWEELKTIQEKIKLLKNQKTEFILKVDDSEFKISAVYQ